MDRSLLGCNQVVGNWHTIRTRIIKGHILQPCDTLSEEDGMLPRVLRLHPGTYQRLLRLSKEAERDGA